MPIKKKKTKPKKTTLKRKCDILFSQYWRKEIGKCERCGAKETLQIAHIITRGVVKLRYERKNIFVLCAACHFWGHKNPLSFSNFVKENKGEDIHDWLIVQSNTLTPLPIEWYIAMYKHLEKKTCYTNLAYQKKN